MRKCLKMCISFDVTTCSIFGFAFSDLLITLLRTLVHRSVDCFGFSPTDENCSENKISIFNECTVYSGDRDRNNINAAQ